MWRSRSKSTVRIHSASASPSPFSCSSFKDIQTLCIEDEPPSPSPKPSVFHRVRLANSLFRTWSTHLYQPSKLPKSLSQTAPDAALPDPAPPPPPPPPPISLPGTENSIVVYFTSLRVVRSTFEDCKSVRSILRGFRVAMEERDVSMDSRFLGELHRVMGQTGLTLPRVFIGGRYVGGAEEVRALHETGRLKKLLEGLPTAADSGVCHVCGDHRFVLCEDCSGGRKVFTDKGGFKQCTACNESGLIRCLSCSGAPFSLSS